MKGDKNRRTVWVREELWGAVKLGAVRLSEKRGERVSAGQILREGARMLLRQEDLGEVLPGPE